METSKSVCLIVQGNYERDARVRRKAEALLKNGYEVDVIALRGKSKPHFSKYKFGGVTIYTIPLMKRRGSYARYVYEYVVFFILAALKVTLLMRRKRYKVIDINTLPDFLVFAGLIPKLMGAKILLDMHEVMPEFFMSKYGVTDQHWMIRFIRWQEKVSLQFADQVITINEPVQKLFESRGLPQWKSNVVMNSVNENLFSIEFAGEKCRKNDKFILMYHGTLTHIYGLDIALSAFAKIKDEMKNAEFWIIGDGPEKKKLERLALQLGLNSKVRFTGMIPQDEIPQLINQCDVGVLATRQDVFLDLSFSNKLPEYIILGKPVIASRLKTLSLYFSGQALAFFEPQNVSELSKKMLELYNNPEQCQKLTGQARREYVPINWGIMKQRYLGVIEKLMPE